MAGCITECIQESINSVVNKIHSLYKDEHIGIGAKAGNSLKNIWKQALIPYMRIRISLACFLHNINAEYIYRGVDLIEKGNDFKQVAEHNNDYFMLDNFGRMC
ncbi:MAG: hypothetical protein C0402_06375 [Thermodesulfovibrio sp.]|nr:hypothetical protein [Thermodesulfovibrio sp.]